MDKNDFIDKLYCFFDEDYAKECFREEYPYEYYGPDEDGYYYDHFVMENYKDLCKLSIPVGNEQVFICIGRDDNKVKPEKRHEAIKLFEDITGLDIYGFTDAIEDEIDADPYNDIDRLDIPGMVYQIIKEEYGDDEIETTR